MIDRPMAKSRNKVKKGKVKTKRGIQFNLEESILDENIKKLKRKLKDKKTQKLETLDELSEVSSSEEGK